ncbi:phage tail tape measure protein [Brevibacillus agri]|uniref:phage tail tape measure protein n=1 Tax=Brevibacillus agri TaxID=51101 RepID=UPI002E1BDDC7|nr:phage tail tape measure protein [Brevibacillus agri]MED1642264.1 phage tail tape measure protein [Brevibacillus agri]MED1652603.1 phage tail tape measure protein [Brevibacillus agri]MED1689643.1 phage tail tape measure protein [Brevibacillus agri]MED1691119.1 phage tail tape measure protein [Brevibacillus agri]MED1696771.1 phage tail tape measure protein [Brevibacillus agri]
MADIEVGDLVARISLDDTGLNKSMAQIQREMKLVASEFEKASAGLQVFGSEEDKLRTKSDHLTKQLALQGQKVELLRQEFKKSAQEKGEDAVATQKLATQLNKAEAAMHQMQAQLNKVNKELAEQPTHMQKWSSGLQEAGNRMQAAGAEIAASFGLAGAAIAAGLGVAVKTAADFEAQMSRVGAIAEASATELQAMKQAAMELGASTSKSASEVAVGMENLAAMGFKVNEIIAAMPGVISAAEASGEDMALVADTMAVSIRAFGLEASQSTHVADVLAKTANISAANMEGMAYALKYAAAPAHTLGLSLEEVAASVAIMSDAGIRGETAGTTLRMALTRLVKPTDETTEVLNLLGVKINDANGNMLPFAEIIGQLNQQMSGLSNSQRAAYLATIFGVEAMSGMMTIVEAGPAKLQALTKELENSTGASAAAAAQMKDNLKGAMEQLNGAIETAQISIGNALTPAIQALGGAIQSVVDWFNQLDPSVQEFVALSAAAGAAVLTLVGAFGAVMAAVGLAATGFGALGTALAGVGAAILPVTLAIAGLTAAGVLLYQNWDTIKAYAIKVWGEIRAFIQPAVDAVAGYIAEKFTELSAWWNQIWPQLKEAFTNIWNGISAVVTPIVNGIVELMKWAWPFVRSIIIAAWEGIKDFIDLQLNLIKGAVEVFAAVFTGDWSGLWESIKTVAANKLTEIKDAVIGWLTQSANSIKEKLIEWKKAFEDWFNEQKIAIPAKLEEWWTGMSEWFSSIPDRITQKLTEWSAAIKKWAEEQHQENIRQFSEWWTAISEWFSSIPSKLSESLAAWKNTIVAWFTDQVSSISNSLSEWSAAITDWFASIPTKLSGSLSDWWTSISTWFSEIPSKLSAKLEEWWVAIKNWFSGLSSKPEIANAGSNMVASLADGAKRMGPSAMDELGKNIVDALVGALAVLGIALLAAGREIIKRFVEGVKSIDVAEIGRNIVQGLAQGIESLSGWIKEKVLSFVEGIGKTIKDFFGIASPSRLMAEYGGYLVEGLWQGIQNMSAWIKSKVTEFASGIANNIKSYFGIRSPSRLMAEYGGYIAEGLAVGMRQNEKAVADAAKAQADIVKKKTAEAKDAAVAHWKEMNAKVKTEADLMSEAITFALGKVRETTQLELAISKQEFELFASTLGNTTADQAKKLEAQMELLRIELATSNETVDLLKAAYDEMAAAKGANSVEAQKLYLELLKEQTAYQGIRKELAELEKSYNSAAQAARNLVIEQGKIFENINGKWVEGGTVGGTVGRDDPIYGDGGAWSDMPDWLKPKPDTDSGSSGSGKKDKYDRDDFKDKDGDFKTPTNDFFDDWHDDLKDLEKGSKSIGKAVKDTLDKVKESFRFPGLATGGTVTGSGWTLVGEKGPELLNLPRGSQVIPNYELPRLGGQAIDYDRLAQAMARMKPSVTQYNTFTSPQALTPSETARKNQQVMRQMALEWGLS